MARLSLGARRGTSPGLPVLRLDSTGGDLHLGKEKSGRQRVGVFPKVERGAEQPGGFPARTESSSTRKEEGPGVTCEAEIRDLLGRQREGALDDSQCVSTPLNWIQGKTAPGRRLRPGHECPRLDPRPADTPSPARPVCVRLCAGGRGPRAGRWVVGGCLGASARGQEGPGAAVTAA